MKDDKMTHLLTIIGGYFVGWYCIKFTYIGLNYIIVNVGALISICIALLLSTLWFKDNKKIFKKLLTILSVAFFILLWIVGLGIYSLIFIGLYCFIKGAINDI